ncbi:hypothetical protein PR048_002563 [Dryococelus australis]|uniref:Uncharacterized protein n=1 Tax=Dryococelus australis TaxID=614101 RepID=A0ABQ9IL88_9NEOP|nr:hypothetical protein PR048_002563 [Dryococelus australis]
MVIEETIGLQEFDRKRRRKGLFPVQPKPPQGFKDYLMNRCTYVLASNASSRMPIPVISPPQSLPEQMKDLFAEQEKERYRLRMQLLMQVYFTSSAYRHSDEVKQRIPLRLYNAVKCVHLVWYHVIEKEKLVLSVEQEILRVHGRAARALANQSLPFSVCTILKDEEVYNVITPEQEEKDRNARSRYNGRLFLSWLQDVDDKWEKIKEFCQCTAVDGLVVCTGQKSGSGSSTFHFDRITHSVTFDIVSSLRLNYWVKSLRDFSRRLKCFGFVGWFSWNSESAEYCGLLSLPEKLGTSQEGCYAPVDLRLTVQSVKEQYPSVMALPFTIRCCEGEGGFQDVRCLYGKNITPVICCPSYGPYAYKERVGSKVAIKITLTFPSATTFVLKGPESMLLRHHNEAESLHAVQKMDWEWKMKELGICEFKVKPVIEELHVPMVHVSDDFDLLPAAGAASAISPLVQSTEYANTLQHVYKAGRRLTLPSPSPVHISISQYQHFPSVQERIAKVQPLAIYSPCANHRLDLAIDFQNQSFNELRQIQKLLSPEFSDGFEDGILKGELRVWKQIWKSGPSQKFPVSFGRLQTGFGTTKYYRSVSTLMYPTGYNENYGALFSRLHHLETYLRSTTTEGQLNGLALLHIHQYIASAMKPEVLDIVAKKPKRKHLLNFI